MTKPDTNSGRAISQKLDDLVQEAMDMQSALWAYREFYEADQEVTEAYGMVSPGLNTPLNSIRQKEYEQKMWKAVYRRSFVKNEIKRIRGEL